MHIYITNFEQFTGTNFQLDTQIFFSLTPDITQ